jgi:putative oxidoreductase
MKRVLAAYLRFMNEKRRETLNDLGLLLLRVGFGGMIAGGHGFGKLMSYGEKAASFPDPLGLGGPLTMALAVLAEFFCGIAVALGLATRLALTQLIATMATAALIVHRADPFATKELALAYLVPFVVLFVTGPGRFSLDGWLVRRLGAASR